MSLLVGMRVVQTSTACEYVRVRTYAKRRARSKRHWARMDKKWLKRFGLRAEPRAYQMGDVLFVHPLLMPELKRSTREVENNLYWSSGL